MHCAVMSLSMYQIIFQSISFLKTITLCKQGNITHLTDGGLKKRVQMGDVWGHQEGPVVSVLSFMPYLITLYLEFYEKQQN